MNWFSRWEVVDLKFEKWIDQNGFVLLESLVSLGILAIVLTVMLPFLVDLLAFRKEEKQQVEMNRVLYDSSQLWEGSAQQSEWVSGKWSYTINFDGESISISEESGSEKKLEILSIE